MLLLHLFCIFSTLPPSFEICLFSCLLVDYSAHVATRHELPFLFQVMMLRTTVSYSSSLRRNEHKIGFNWKTLRNDYAKKSFRSKRDSSSVVATYHGIQNTTQLARESLQILGWTKARRRLCKIVIYTRGRQRCEAC
jgi:hypothetical protein